MLKSRKALLITVGLAILGTAAGLLAYSNIRRIYTAHASPGPDLLSALPPGAPTLVYIDLAAVRASTFYQHRPDKGPIALPDKDYADFVHATGFDFEKDLDRVVIASWPASSAKEKSRSVAVADGRFDRAKIRDYAMRKGKLDHQEGHDVFLFPTTGAAGWNAVSFLSDRRIAIVEGPRITPLFDKNGAAADPTGGPSSDPARERAARLDGAAMFAISRVPAVPDNFAPGGMQSTQLATLARSVQWVTLAARPEGDNVRVSLEGECTNATDARQLQAALEVLRLFGTAALEGSKTRQSMDPATYAVLDSMLKSADVTASAERVRILVELTPEVLKLGRPANVH